MAFNPAETIAPRGVYSAGTNATFLSGGKYYFQLINGSPIVEYVIDVNHSDVKKGMLLITETTTGMTCIKEGGTRYRTTGNSVKNPLGLANMVTNMNFSHSLSNNILTLEYTETVEGKQLTKRFDIEIMGKTLLIHAYALNPYQYSLGNYAGIEFGRAENLVNGGNILLSYAEFSPVIYTGSPRKYLSRFFDQALSSCNRWKQDDITINTPTAQTYCSKSNYIGSVQDIVPSLDDMCYVTVSDNMLDTVVGINRPPSPNRADLNKRVDLDIWNLASPPVLPGAKQFDRSKYVMDTLRSYGMEDLIFYQMGWQSFGIGPCFSLRPKQYPANVTYGGDAGLKLLSDTAKSYGYLFGVYVTYDPMFDTPEDPSQSVGPQWDPSKLIRDPQNNLYNYGFINYKCHQINGIPQPMVMRTDVSVTNASIDLPLISSTYGLTTIFNDVLNKIASASSVDHADVNNLSRTYREVYNNLKTIFAMEKSYFGPTVGEGGGNDSTFNLMYAGIMDGVEGESKDGRDTPNIPDFELRIVKPVMMRQGMGYIQRWINAQDGTIDYASYDYDANRSTALLYGHGGLMSDHGLFGDPNWTVYTGAPTPYQINLVVQLLKYYVKEYYTYRAVQEMYLGANVVDILYNTSTRRLVPLQEAIDQGVDFMVPQMYISYDNGLEMYINKSDQLWTVNLKGKSYYIPKDGWAIAGPNIEMHSSLVDVDGTPKPYGHRVDYIRSDKYIYVDGRGWMIRFGKDYFGNLIATDRAYVVRPDGFTLSQQVDDTFVPNMVISNSVPSLLGPLFALGAAGLVANALNPNLFKGALKALPKF